MDTNETSTKTLLGKQDCIEAVDQLIVQAERHVALFTQQLEPDLYNNDLVCDHLAKIARTNRLASIRIIAKDTRTVLSQGHCLINLAQRLSSFIQIRNPATPELQRFSESWLLVDQSGFCRINNPDRFEGTLFSNDRLQVKDQMEFFDNAWENSQPDPNIRRLNI